MVLTDFAFQPIDRSQADRLNEINQSCPIEADFTLVFERGPDFFKWPDLIFDRHLYIGAFYRERLVGYLGLGLFTGWTDEGFGLCSYLGDARVLPEFRGRRLAEQMMQAMEEYVPSEVQFGFALVKKGNLPAEALAESVSNPVFEGYVLGDFTVLNIPLLGAPSMAPDITVRNAIQDDLGAMANLFEEANRDRPFSPLLTADTLARDLERLPNLALNDYWLAERDGRLVGMIAAWDMYPFHFTRLLRYSIQGQMFRTAYYLLSRWYPGALALPAAGGVLRTLTLTRMAIQDQDHSILHALLVRILQAKQRQRYHLLSVGFPDGDPLIEGAKGLTFVQRFESTLYCISRKPKTLYTHGLPPYVDLSMI